MSLRSRYERINKWAAIVKVVCDKPRRDKHCCEKLKQIPHPKFRDRKFVKGLHNNVDHARSPSSLQSAFVANGYEKGLWRTTNNLSKEFVPLRVQGESRFQVSRKVAFTLKYLFFAISNNLFTFVLWNSLKNGSRDLYRVKGAVQAHSLTKLSLLAQSKLYPATSSLVQAERLALKGEQGFIAIDHSVFRPEMRCIATY